MHPIKLSIHWHGAAQDDVLLSHIAPYIVAPALIYMVKLMIIARNPTVRGWHDWRFDGDYDGYDTVGEAIDACRKQQEFLPEPWQFSIIIVEFDCRVPSISWKPPEKIWMSEFTSEKPKIGGRFWGDPSAAQLAFLGGFHIGTPPGYDRPRFEF